MTTIALHSGISFLAKEGSSILESAMSAGFSLPYSCKAGRCSTCKCKVVQGSTVALHPESGLTDEERDEGWILSCVRAAQSDVLLNIDDLGDIKLPTARTLPCKIAEIRLLAPDVALIKLRLPPTSGFNFVPGQYVDVIGPNGVRRSYSLASCRFEQQVLELHVRRVDGGVMSRYWFGEAKVNELLRLHGPLGTFFLREFAGVDLIFLATGTGIAPVKAMLESIADVPAGKQPKSVTVLWGGRMREDLYIDLSAVSVKHRYIPVLSRAGADWEGARGHVQQVLLSLQLDLKNAVVYACGSDSMIHDAERLLKQAGLPENRFYSDAFVCSATN